MSYPANLRGWGPGWPANRRPDMSLVEAASGAKWLVHEEIAPIVQFVVDRVESLGYLFDHGPDDVDDDWGYANRAIRGTSKPSNHSWGLAIDFDAQEYPQHSTRRAPQWIYDLFYEYGFEIGADWGRAYVDPMHVEFRGSITEARFTVAMLAAVSLQPPPYIPPVVAPVVAPPDITPMPIIPPKDPIMYVRNKEDGSIWVLSATHCHHLTGPEWDTRVKNEGAQAWEVEELQLVSLTMFSGRVKV